MIVRDTADRQRGWDPADDGSFGRSYSVHVIMTVSSAAMRCSEGSIVYVVPVGIETSVGPPSRAFLALQTRHPPHRVAFCRYVSPFFQDTAISTTLTDVTALNHASSQTGNP
jgi:hypothetical protein